MYLVKRSPYPFIQVYPFIKDLRVLTFPNSFYKVKLAAFVSGSLTSKFHCHSLWSEFKTASEFFDYFR